MTDFQKLEYHYNNFITLNKEKKEEYLEELLRQEPEIYQHFSTLYQKESEASVFFDQLQEKIATLDQVEKYKPGTIIGNYKLEELIGTGGMANVYKAKRVDGVFDRQSAIKFIKRGIDTAEVINRFRHERNILAQLQHEHIAQLYDGGVTPDGLPYFVMEFIDGKDIISYCKQENLDLRDRLHLYIKVCDAIEFAHKNLVVHRDIKPGNILIDSGRKVKLMDFGIAKLLAGSEKEFQTRLHDRVLTPEYASPEQRDGDYINVTSDIYQLGLLLHEIITYSKLTNRLEHSPGFKVNKKSIPTDLVSIIETTTRIEPSERYNSVGSLKDDILHYLKDEPVKAKGNDMFYRAKKYIKRNRGKIAVTFLTLFVIGTLVVKYVHDVTEARKTAEYRSMHANSTMNFLLSTFANQLPRKAGGDTLTVFDLMTRMENQLQDDKSFFRENLSRVYNLMADINYRYKNFEKSRENFLNALKHHENDPYDPKFSARHKYISLIGLGRHYYGTQQRDSSVHYYTRAIEFALQRNLNPIEAYTGLGKLELLTNNYEVADSIFKMGMFYASKPDIPSQESKAFFLAVYGNFLGRYFPHENKEKIDSLFMAAVEIYNQPVRYNSNMDYIRKNERFQFFKRKDTLLGPPLKIQHPTSFAEVINYYGIYNYNLEKFDTALHQFETAYQLNAQYYGKNSIVALENANNMAIIYKEMGNLNKALETFKNCWQASNENETIPRPFSVNFYHNYVVTLYLKEEYRQSILAFDTLLILKKKHTPDDHFGFNHAYRHIGQNLYKLGKPREALEYLQMVVDRHREHAGDKGFQDVNALLQMIVIQGELGNHQRADEFYQENLGIIKRRFGNKSTYIHRNYIAKASAFLKLDKPDEVIALLKPALADSIDSHHKNYLRFLYAKGHYLNGNKPVADSIFVMLERKPKLEPKVRKALVAFHDDFN